MPPGRMVDTSPLIFLTTIGQLEVLHETGLAVSIPDVVADEVDARGTGDPTSVAIRAAGWLRIVPTPPIPAEVLAFGLDPGESAVLALALDHPGSEVILDDMAARRCASAPAIPARGTLGLLVLAKQAGRIAEIRPLIAQLRVSGMYLSDAIAERVIRQCGESPTDP